MYRIPAWTLRGFLIRRLDLLSCVVLGFIRGGDVSLMHLCGVETLCSYRSSSGGRTLIPDISRCRLGSCALYGLMALAGIVPD